MFEELTEELLDLSANVRGYGSAVYAVVDDTLVLERGLQLGDPLLHLHDALLVSTDAASAGRVPERPALAPWCRLAEDGRRVLVEHGGTVVTFEGRAAEALLPRLLPLLDGTRTVEDVESVLGRPVAPAIAKALALLAANRLLVDGEHRPFDDGRRDRGGIVRRRGHPADDTGGCAGGDRAGPCLRPRRGPERSRDRPSAATDGDRPRGRAPARR